MKKHIFFPLLIILLSIPIKVSAQFTPIETDFKIKPPGGVGLGNTAAIGGTSAESLVETIITNTLNIFFTIGGLGVLIYFVWGAMDWILSGGDKEKVSNARKKMTHAIIGLILLSLSFVLINIIGTIVGFNPLGNLQLRDLGTGVN